MGSLCLSRLRRETKHQIAGALTYDGLARVLSDMGPDVAYAFVDQVRDWTGWFEKWTRNMEQVKQPRQWKFFLGLNGVPVATCRLHSEHSQLDDCCAPQTIFVQRLVSVPDAPVAAQFWHETSVSRRDDKAKKWQTSAA